MTPNPIMRFEDGGFPDYVMCEIHNAGFAAPTPIQSQGFSISLTGQDFVGIAQTGSGKTLGYMLPAISHCGPDGCTELSNNDCSSTVLVLRRIRMQK